MAPHFSNGLPAADDHFIGSQCTAEPTRPRLRNQWAAARLALFRNDGYQATPHSLVECVGYLGSDAVLSENLRDFHQVKAAFAHGKNST